MTNLILNDISKYMYVKTVHCSIFNSRLLKNDKRKSTIFFPGRIDSKKFKAKAIYLIVILLFTISIMYQKYMSTC